MNEILNRVAEELNRFIPNTLLALKGPTSEGDIKKLGKIVGLPLPADFLALYGKWGGNDSEGKLSNFVYGLPLLSIEEINQFLEECIRIDAFPIDLQYADEGIKINYLHGPKRIPICMAGPEFILCVDLDPSPTGTYGQVIGVDSESCVALLLNSSVEDLMKSFATDIFDNKYTLDEDALEDGVYWLKPVDDIDPNNWQNSERWCHVDEAIS